jgi:hypothetical protein
MAYGLDGGDSTATRAHSHVRLAATEQPSSMRLPRFPKPSPALVFGSNPRTGRFANCPSRENNELRSHFSDFAAPKPKTAPARATPKEPNMSPTHYPVRAHHRSPTRLILEQPFEAHGGELRVARVFIDPTDVPLVTAALAAFARAQPRPAPQPPAEEPNGEATAPETTE